MKHGKTLALVAVVLLVLLLGWLILYRPETPPSGNQQTQGEESEGPWIELSLMPDFALQGVWVYGSMSGAQEPPLPLAGDKPFVQSHNKDNWRYFFGWWKGSRMTNRGDGAYELRLPELELRPADRYRMRVVSGVVLTGTVLLPADPAFTAYAPPVLGRPPYELQTYGEYGRIDLAPLTLEVSRSMTLTVSFYPFKQEVDLTLTPLLVETVLTDTASATGRRTRRRFSGVLDLEGDQIPYVQAGLMGRGQIRLEARTVKGDEERSAVALLTAFRNEGMRVAGVHTDQWQRGLSRLLQRSLDFPSFPTLRRVGVLSRHKPSFLEVTTRGEISATILEEASGLVLQAPFQLHVWRPKPFPGDEHWEEQMPPPLPRVYTDTNTVIGEQQLRLQLGRILLGPEDVLRVTVEDAAWGKVNPEPDEMTEHWRQVAGSPQRHGFTFVYHGPRSFWLDVRYRPAPSLFARQSVALARGQSRTWEFSWSTFAREQGNNLKDGVAAWVRWAGLPYGSGIGTVVLVLCVLAPLLVLWVLYQRSIPGQQLPHWLSKWRRKSSGELEAGTDADPASRAAPAATRRKRVIHIVLRSVLLLYVLAILLASVYSDAWQIVADPFQPHIISDDKWIQLPEPTAVLLVSAAWLLLRLDTLLFRRGWVLVGISALSLLLEISLDCLYPWELLNGIRFSTVTGMLSGATSVALLPLVLVLFWRGWWADKELGGKPRLRHQDLHALAFAALGAATFEVLDASLMALAALFVLWLLLSLLLDRARPLRFKGEGRVQAPVPPRAADEQDSKTQIPSQDKGSLSAWVRVRTLVATVDVVAAVLGLWEKVMGQHLHLERPRGASGEQKEEATSQESPGPESLSQKMNRVVHPLFAGGILVVAIILSRDPFLQAQLVPFGRSPLPWLDWLQRLLDPMARVATTLVPCLAMVLLTVLSDSAMEHWLAARAAKVSETVGIYLKGIGLALLLFLVFVLGIGGLTLFVGAFGLKLTDRFVYYVTVPLLTSIWLDLWPAEGGWDLTKWRDAFKGNVETANRWLRVILALLSILAPWLISSAATEQVDEVIKILQTLQF